MWISGLCYKIHASRENRGYVSQATAERDGEVTMKGSAKILMSFRVMRLPSASAIAILSCNTMPMRIKKSPILKRMCSGSLSLCHIRGIQTQVMLFSRSAIIAFGF